MCITESLCCTPEIKHCKSTYTSIKKKKVTLGIFVGLICYQHVNQMQTKQQCC